MKRYLLTGFVGLSLLLAACGGSTPPPSNITLTVEDPVGSFAAAAYQVGPSGSWQQLNMSGSGGTWTATFSLGGQSKYGVAVRCGDSVNVIQATNSELANPKIVCSYSNGVSFTVNVNIDSSLLASGDQVCVNDVSCESAAASTNIAANLEPGSNRDLLITLKDGSGSVKVAKVQRGVNVTSGGSATVSLGPGDQLEAVNFTAPSAPGGYTVFPFPGASVFYLSANNTADGILNASPTSYRPVSGFSGGDRYVAIAAATASNAALFIYQLFSSGSPSLSFPQPWSSGSLTIQQNAHPIVSGLSRTDSDLRAYQIDLLLTSQLHYTTVLSKGWLGNNTIYSVPDLSSNQLLGYAPPSNGINGTLEVAALLSNSNKIVLSETDLAALVAGDYYKAAIVSTPYTVGGGQTPPLP